MLVIVPPTIVPPLIVVGAPVVSTPPFIPTVLLMVLVVPPFRVTFNIPDVDEMGALTLMPVNAFKVSVASAPAVFVIALLTAMLPSGVETVELVPVLSAF